MAADLAILIVTLKRRRQYFARLMRCLQPQLSSRVNVYALEDGGAEKIGEKRQRLIESVKHESHLCFIDDDDMVASTYCSDILEALDDDPDVVGFRLRYFEDGKLRGNSIISVTCERWHTETGKGLDVHYRTPNHLSPVRRKMALAAGFPPKDHGEDAAYSYSLMAKFPKMKEFFIDKVLYDYYYRTPRHRAEGENLTVPEVV